MTLSPVLDRLPVLILSPHARCNCRCVMCDIWKETSSNEISAGDVEKWLCDIQSLQTKWVVLSGGEPLMHSDLFAICGVLRSHGARITLLSTGLLLARHAERIVTHIDDVIVSLDGPSAIHDAIRRVPGAFFQLSKGIRSLRQAKDAFPVAARCTVQSANHAHLVATVEAAVSLGLDSVSFLAADVTSQAFNRSEVWPQWKQRQIGLTGEQVVTLEAQFEQIDRLWGGTRFVLEGRDKLQSIVRHFRAQLHECEPRAPRCTAPWVSAVIEADGAVKPCFFHAPVGSLKNRNLPEILNGPEAVAFRKTLDVASNPICKNCVCSLSL